jgi:hypothetical protein
MQAGRGWTATGGQFQGTPPIAKAANGAAVATS